MLSDIGCAVLAWPDERLVRKRPPSDLTVPICTVHYRAPDMLLGHERFGPDLDMWSLGCVAAELFLREPLFQLEGEKQKNAALSMRTLLSWGRRLGTPARSRG